MGRRAFLRLALVGAGAAALGRPRWATAEGMAGVDGSPAGVAVGHGRAVAVGQDSSGAPAAWWSLDAERWTRAASMPRGAAFGDVTAVAGGFVAVGSTAGLPSAWWSSDGASWDLLGTLPRRGQLVAVASAGRAVLAGGAEQGGESNEGTGALLASIDRTGAWGTLATDGVGDLRHGSVTALARHGASWVLAGMGTGASGLWRSTSSGTWEPASGPGREPALGSALLSLPSGLVALGTSVVGEAVHLARSGDGRHWVVGAVPDALAALGVDLRGVDVVERGQAVVASATGAITSLLDGVTG